MLKHSLIYFVGRFGASAISLLAVAVYTRLLAPDEYGVYALVLSGALTAYAVLSQWLTFALSRFLPAYQGRESVVTGHVATAFAAICVVVVAGVLIALPWTEAGPERTMVLMGVAVFLAMTPAEMVLATYQMRSEAGRYVQLALLRAVLTTGIGLALAWLGWGSLGLLTGVVIGHLCIVLACVGWISRSVREAHLRRSFFAELGVYGLPAALTSALGALIHASDRYIIGLLLGVEAAGLYSAPYDLTMRSLYVLMQVVAMAGNPFVMRAFESDGAAVARPLMRRQAELLLGVALPATIACVLLAPAIATALLGEAFRPTARLLMPWIAFGTVLLGFQTLYLALSFSLPRKPLYETAIVGIAALINLGLTFLLIPMMGLVGAAVATVVAYAFLLLASIVVGGRLLAMPLPWGGMARILLACTVWTAILWPVRETTALLPVSLHVLAGGIVYLLLIGALDVGGTRQGMLQATRAVLAAAGLARR